MPGGTQPGEKRIAAALIISTLGALGLAVVYVRGGQTQLEGALLGVSFGGLGVGLILWAKYLLPGTPALTDPMLPLIPKYDALLMANHGAVCYGADVWKAFFKMETMEHFARISLVAELLGGAKVLPRLEVDKLLDSRTRYGVKAKSSGEPGCPVAAEDIGAARAANPGGEEFFYVSRAELIGLVDEALKARGLA